MRPVHAPDWLPRFLELVQARRPGPALDCLRQAHARTHGFGPGWDAAALACLRAGFASGCRALLDWGIPLPTTRQPGVPTARAWALVQACVAEGGPRRPAIAGPATWLPVFRLPDDTPTPPLAGESPRALVEVLCQPPAPPLSPAEWQVAWSTHRSQARQALEQGRVQPWAGKAACVAVAAVLPELLGPSIPSSHPDLVVLLAHLPPARAAGSAPLCKRVLEELHRHAQGQLMAKSQPNRPLARALEALRACGQSLASINEASAARWGESLFTLAVRYNEPGVFQQALSAGLSPWSSRANGVLTSSPLRKASGLMGMLAHRLARQDNAPVGEQWWALATQLSQTPHGRGWWRRADAPAVMEAAPGRLSAHCQRWETLCRGARFSSAWIEPDPETPAAPPSRRARL